MGFFDWLFGKKKGNRVVDRGPTTIQVGDVVSYDGTDYMVKGRVVFEDGGARWYSYKLVDGDDELWLGADDDGMIWMGIFRDIKLHVEEPVGRQIEYEGSVFELEEKGRARATISGETGKKTGFRMKYWDFCDDDDRMISLEQWGEDGIIEASFGEEITMDDLVIYPSTESTGGEPGRKRRGQGF
ncbi:MAG: hypothetical protein CVV64_02400 [Candidatus Wallbacteria bacterium HGW-Wallbacteria-1]|jgi:hypothetical protein|uniref:DUF4178 domain-containing protein n=1 Tax=Candidatus Wallbacteria bacterium HGW-Wallbacteria-1 TaxID=2013854 RepID=A0A2N1PVA7_9BACT|nr:MAG: hypothetical protein CVV64_02400 [Candidatus Wallbacteria bacterium HGW-Wallbacteria-1]